MSQLVNKAKNFVSDKLSDVAKPEASVMDVDFKRVTMDSAEYLAKVEEEPQVIGVHYPISPSCVSGALHDIRLSPAFFFAFQDCCRETMEHYTTSASLPPFSLLFRIAAERLWFVHI
ncbi:hypothetical protein TSUD_167990 [Trifolium subterraneum]|nr:hypothetical protein TSUD_167990 [Trifolium subterraneum]